MLEVRDIHTYYGDSHVLQGISLRVERGQVVGILGRNGMGKTTLIRSIIGFTRAPAGPGALQGPGHHGLALEPGGGARPGAGAAGPARLPVAHGASRT